MNNFPTFRISHLPFQIGKKNCGNTISSLPYSYFSTHSFGFGFTLVELLIVISVILILAALIAPSLQNALKMAHRAACLSNVRQVTIAALSYEEANHNLWMMGADTGGYYGSYSGNYAFQNVYTGYIGANTTGFATVNAAIINSPDAVLRCPSNPKKNFGSGHFGSFAMYCGSAPDFRISVARAMKAFMKLRAINYVFGPAPALWGDRCIVSPGGPYGTEADSNHLPSAQEPEGGNIGHIDGSAHWYNFWGVGIPINTEYAYTSHGIIGGQVKIPNSSLFPRVNGAGTASDSPFGYPFLYAGNRSVNRDSYF